MTRPKRSRMWSGPGGLFRGTWFGPAVLAGLFVVVLGGLLLVLQGRLLEQRRMDLLTSAQSAGNSIQRLLDTHSKHLSIFSQDVAGQAMLTDVVRQRLAAYLADHPELTSLRYLDEAGAVAWFLSLPSVPAEKRAAAQTGTSRRIAEKAAATLRPAYSTTFMTMRDEPAMEVYLPAMHEGACRGVVVGRYSWKGLLREALPGEVLRNHHIELLDHQGHDVMALAFGSGVDERLVRTVKLDPPGNGVAIRLSRYGAGIWGWGVSLLAGLCVSLVIGMAWGMWSLNRHISRRARAEAALRRAHEELEQRVQARTADLAAANEQLQQEMVDRRQAEDRLQSLRDQLAHVARLTTMGEMAAGMAHELNQPLGAIASYAEGCVRLVEAGDVDQEELVRATDTMSEQAKRAGRIIHQLREFVADRTPERSATNLAQLASEVVELIAAEARHSGANIVIQMPDRLPDVWVDRIQIQQVLVNLIRNGIEAVQEGHDGNCRITVTAANGDGKMVQISVVDTGGGISSDQLPKMFDAFFTTKQHGMGMGLSISRSIIEAHGGRLWATVNPHRGLTIRFTLPTPEPSTS